MKDFRGVSEFIGPNSANCVCMVLHYYSLPLSRPGHGCKCLDGVAGDLIPSSEPQNYKFRQEED